MLYHAHELFAISFEVDDRLRHRVDIWPRHSSSRPTFQQFPVIIGIKRKIWYSCSHGIQSAPRRVLTQRRSQQQMILIEEAKELLIEQQRTMESHIRISAGIR